MRVKETKDCALKRHMCERLKAARLARGYKTAKSFALAHGLKVSTYSLHEAGTRAMSFDVLEMYCELLNIPPGWLLNTQAIPVLDWSEILLFPASVDLSKKDWTVPDPELPPPSFGVVVQDDHMEPRYPRNTLLLIDLHEQPQDREFGLFADKKDNIVFRQLIEEDGTKYMRTLQGEFCNKITRDITILGKVVQAKFKPYHD